MSAPRDETCSLNEQAVGWAFHALEPDEEMAVLLHLPQCPSCRRAVQDAEDVLAELGGSVEQVDPPRGLRAGILAAAAETPQEHVGEVRTPSPAVPQRRRVVVREPANRPRRGADRPPARRSWATRGRVLTVAAAFVAVLAVGGLAVRTAQLERQSETLTAQAQSIADLVGQLDRPGVQHAILDGESGATTAAVVLADGQRQVFTVGLPANGNDRTYVLWGLHAGAQPPSALGAFDVATADTGVRTVGAVGPNDGYVGYAISIEPGHSPPATPTTVVASGQVQA